MHLKQLEPLQTFTLEGENFWWFVYWVELIFLVPSYSTELIVEERHPLI